MGFDVCVVTDRCSTERIERGLRSDDRLLVWDNTNINLGFPAGANRAARTGSGDRLLFCNPDLDLLPGALDELEAAVSAPGVVAAEASQGHELDRGPEPEWLSGARLAVRRWAFEAAGGFDERLWMYAEDVDLSLRLARLGRLRHVPAARVRHDAEGRDYPFRLLQLNYRNGLTVRHWNGDAEPLRMARDGIYDLRQGRRRSGMARLSGAAEYLVRTRHWPPRPEPIP